MTLKKRKKKSLKTKLIDDCDEEVKRIVRERDMGRCQKCGKPVRGKNAHTSHVKTKKRFPYLRFDLNNVKLLCYFCHMQWWHKEISEAWEWFEREFPYRADYLYRKIREEEQIGRMNEIMSKRGSEIEWLEATLEQLKQINGEALITPNKTSPLLDIIFPE